ncbi:MAG: lipid-A-disaccharide synthase [Bacteroidaceae bacterium]|nr:lipid-A-disaccharide synthase [Bacteroidaceae bacterium]MBQ8543445.1 lipid-A-disaccharide synthase [Bacteroidaceae bacterium]
MKYYLIVGEASGDLHASNLMKALKEVDKNAEFRFFGGDLMAQVGGTCVKHYRDHAFMGFVPVLLNLRTIFANMAMCKADIKEWAPDVLILVDYPGFNLSIARDIHATTDIPVYYYIAPKVWASREGRIKNIKRDVDEIFSILPFEVDYFKKHRCDINYIGNPCVDAVDAYRGAHPRDDEAFRARYSLGEEPVVALLAGSRKHEIADNLPMMLDAMKRFPEYRPVIAGAPGIEEEFYAPYLAGGAKIIFGDTYNLLNHAHAALVTSGTATLETALFRVPQVVCYSTPVPWLISKLKPYFLKVKYISLVNLIANDEVVRELVAADMKVSNIIGELEKLLPSSSPDRAAMLAGYDRMIDILGEPGASRHAAERMVQLLKK